MQLYGYFDPMGFSVLTRTEQGAVKKQLVAIFEKGFEPTTTATSASSSSLSAPSLVQQHTIAKLNNVEKAWQGFLKSINKDLPLEMSSTTTTIQGKMRNYRNLATKL